MAFVFGTAVQAVDPKVGCGDGYVYCKPGDGNWVGVSVSPPFTPKTLGKLTSILVYL